MFLIRQYILCICLVRNGTILSPFMPTSQNIIQYWFINNMIITNKCVSRMTSVMPSEFHSYVILEVSYIICKVPTNLWLLVDVQTCTLFIFVGFNYVSMVTISKSNGLGWRFPDIARQAIISCEPLLHQYT